jgi:hypothetical protein
LISATTSRSCFFCCGVSVLDSDASPLSLAARRIGEANLSESARAGLDVARFWVGEQCEL